MRKFTLCAILMIGGLAHAATVYTVANAPVVSISGHSYHTIPRILNMKDGDTLPDGITDDYDPRLIGASIVQRLHIHEQTEPLDSGYDYYKQSVLQRLFTPDHIPAIMKYGFENLHQVGRSGGCSCTEMRQVTEDKMAHLTLEASYKTGWQNPMNEVRPQYMLFNLTDNATHRSLSLVSSYGSTVASYKDEVKSRATFTPGDSLNQSVSGFHTLSYRSKTEFQQRYNFYDSYDEAQVWGGLTLADVDYILINCSQDYTLTDEQINELKQTGLPIYSCKWATAGEGPLLKGDLIDAGHPDIVKQFIRPISGKRMKELEIQGS